MHVTSCTAQCTCYRYTKQHHFCIPHLYSILSTLNWMLMSLFSSLSHLSSFTFQTSHTLLSPLGSHSPAKRYHRVQYRQSRNIISISISIPFHRSEADGSSYVSTWWDLMWFDRIVSYCIISLHYVSMDRWCCKMPCQQLSWATGRWIQQKMKIWMGMQNVSV
jgi:hypothetical protein